MSGMSRPKRYGHGRWPRKRLYAIVAHYWSVGRDPEWVATKLGVGPALVSQIFDYLDERDHEPYQSEVDHSGGPLDVVR